MRLIELTEEEASMLLSEDCLGCGIEALPMKKQAQFYRLGDLTASQKDEIALLIKVADE